MTVFHQFGSSGEFRTRPDYREDVAPRQGESLQIVGSYRVERPVRCGVLHCRQTHEHGYVVAFADGTETNTGWDCGLDHFGLEFLPLRQQYDRAEREHAQRQALGASRAQVEQMAKALQGLQVRAHGGNWLLQNLQHFEKLYPPALLRILRGHAAQGAVNVIAAPLGGSIELDLADPEVDAAGMHHLRATVQGLRIFTLDTNDWPLFRLERELNEFLRLDAATIAVADVAGWRQWVEALAPRLAEFERLLSDGKGFFRRGNMELLPYLAQDQELREQLSWIVLGEPADGKARSAPEQGFWQRKLKRLMLALNQ